MKILVFGTTEPKIISRFVLEPKLQFLGSI